MTYKNLIYGLESPIDNQIYYIGKTTTGLKRPFSHRKQTHNKELNEWLKSLDREPIVKIIERVEDEYQLSSRERYWINHYKNHKQPLLNKQIPNERQLNFIDYQIGKFVQEQRKLVKLTQKEFADKSGLGLRFVRDLEQGKESCRMDKVLQALQMFGATLVPLVK
jgi:y4mF family transcriptional regulator